MKEEVSPNETTGTTGDVKMDRELSNSDFSSEDGSSDVSDLDKFEEAYEKFGKLTKGVGTDVPFLYLVPHLPGRRSIFNFQWIQHRWISVDRMLLQPLLIALADGFHHRRTPTRWKPDIHGIHQTHRSKPFIEPGQGTALLQRLTLLDPFPPDVLSFTVHNTLTSPLAALLTSLSLLGRFRDAVLSSSR